MAIEAEIVRPMDAIPYIFQEEGRWRRVADLFVTRALEELLHTEERLGFFRLIDSIPSTLLADVSVEDIEVAKAKRKQPGFNFVSVHQELHGVVMGYNLTLESSVSTTANRELVRHWFELAVIIADIRLNDRNKMH